MNDLPELESELKKLRPRAVSSGLSTRIERALNEAKSTTPSAAVLPKRRNIRVNWFGLGLGLAAAAVFLVLARVNVERTPGQKQSVVGVTPVPFTTVAPANDSFVPVGLTQVVYSRRDEGLHFPNNASEPVRRVRSQKRETLQWHNPVTGTSLRVSYPSEEVTLTPVSGQ